MTIMSKHQERQTQTLDNFRKRILNVLFGNGFTTRYLPGPYYAGLNVSRKLYCKLTILTDILEAIKGCLSMYVI